MQKSPRDHMAKMQDKVKEKMYVSWRNTQGQDCKMMGPETKCLCNHRYKEHNIGAKQSKTVPCQAARCPCRQFYYVPTHGAYDFKCLCKHSFKDHDPVTKKCKNSKCVGCPNGKFSSTWTCSCGLKFGQHVTVVETYEERRQAGRLIGQMARMAQQLDRVHIKGGLLNPAEEIPEKPEPPVQSIEQKKKQRLQRLNNLIANRQEEIQQEIEEQPSQAMLQLYMRPHNYRKVEIPIKTRKN